MEKNKVEISIITAGNTTIIQLLPNNKLRLNLKL